jgi:hypothetical protein
LFPEEIGKKDIDFVLDSSTCQFALAKFVQRLQILSDPEAFIIFNSVENGQSQNAFFL